nr:polyprotein [Bidens mottle virus]
MATAFLQSVSATLKHNLMFGTNYTKYHVARHHAAQKRGLVYKPDQDVYKCSEVQFISLNLDAMRRALEGFNISRRDSQIFQTKSTKGFEPKYITYNGSKHVFCWNRQYSDHCFSKRCREEESHRSTKTATSRRQKVAQSFKRACVISDSKFTWLLKQVKNIGADKNLTVEVIGKKRNVIRYKNFRTNVGAFIEVQHVLGKRARVDLKIPDSNIPFVQVLAKTNVWGMKVKTLDLKRGDSGVILNPKKLYGKQGRSSHDMFIVRGNCEGQVFDARSRVTFSIMSRMTHFSLAENFWRGLDTNWAKYRKSVSHKCTADFSVSDCGNVTAILTQSLTPCFKLTCGKCAQAFVDLTFKEACRSLHEGATEGIVHLDGNASNFHHTKRMLEVVRELSSEVSVEDSHFDEIFRMIGSRTQSPFTHINALNNFFLKGKTNTTEEWRLASENLLELARFQKNRTDNIKKGDLASFRNKLSAKANYNYHLFCSNQQDKNASFVWGQREYHAKRIFTQYFQEIDPALGYTAYQRRKLPDSIRELATGNLIVSMDLANFREQMRGKDTQQGGVTKSCTSSKDGNFLYPCCCVTQEDGTPVLSTVYPPTKKHMVVGNSGDSKYVDMPKGESELLYMAKDGYCYLNIYLAMLVNIKEDEAKDFTKRIRDSYISKLGMWPTLLDLATTCAQLRIFYPDVHDAELPRILVDHKNQICHVVDSFGSISTGYHILKASTVAQLVLFADDNLESDIKHYRVGGRLSTPPPDHADNLSDFPADSSATPFAMSEFAATKLLIKGVFRPNLMKRLLLEEPYIMMLSLVSPGVLMAMYNNGAFEMAVQLWINDRQSIATIAVMLSNLAKKVSLADTLMQQKTIIDSSANDLLNNSFDGFQLYMTYHTSTLLLQRMRARYEGDQPLVAQGFLNYEQDVIKLMEKNYLDLLEESWRELSWREKFQSIWHARKSSRYFTENLKPARAADFNGMYDISPRAYFTKVLNRTQDRIKTTKQAVSVYIDRKCVSVTTFLVRRILNRLPNLITIFNSLIVFSVLLSIAATLHHIITQHRSYQKQLLGMEQMSDEAASMEIYSNLQRKLERNPTWDEFIQTAEVVNPSLAKKLRKYEQPDNVSHQGSTEDTRQIEQIIAFVTLVLMTFDAERSDCVFKTLNKFKGTVSSLNSTVRHQSLDDIIGDFDERNGMIDFDLDDNIHNVSSQTDETFGKWWVHQTERGHTIPHYRTEGLFMEFTRANAARVASDIIQSTHIDFLIRGAVGSGKSTGLPFHLSNHGEVLLVEPTRPLTENVYKQLSGNPFFLKPTIRMRGCSVFGSSPVSVMTSGFALHYFANNSSQLNNFKYIIFDECHVLDASAMAFRSLISVYHPTCKVLKVSATPPGREVEFTTQFPVKLVVEENLSFNSFVNSLKTLSNADVLKYGSNILVYVASYSEVDNLSKMLTDKGMKVTKVDGRTMKHGSLEITTSGTTTQPHFVVATNIIENGVTLDIDVVVDFGMKVSPFLDVDNRSIVYNKVNISYGERIQRLGRVGRFKEGTALRIGSTEKGLIEIPSMIATEAALYCFAYNLPVMTSNASTSIISECTVKQVRTMHQFELNPLFTFNFVSCDGTMHPMIHETLKKYKLHDSITPLCEQSIPYKASGKWLSVRCYEQIGVRIDANKDVKVAFHIKDIPPPLHEELWNIILKFKHTALFPTIKTSSISKIAYTLQTDIHSISRTLARIDLLLEDERTKQAELQNLVSNNCTNMYSILGIANTLRARYSQDYTGENIRKLEAAKSQLREFNNIRGSADESNIIGNFEALQYVHHQSKESLASAMNLKGIWAKSLVARDLLVAGAVAIGGAAILWKWFRSEISLVRHQGYSKSKKIKALKFRKARDKRAGFEIDGNDDTLEEYFGSAYTKKGKGKGTTIGMGKSHRKFINMYGFEPGEYSYIRFVDPLTGAQIEENVYADILDVQKKFGEIRTQKIIDDELEPQATYSNPNIHAYFIKDWSNKALKVDLTPHNPLLVSERASLIMKYPEREGELRQTGQGVEVDVSEIPKGEASHESKSLLRGLRDFNPVATVVCKLIAKTDTGIKSMHGIGFGSYLIANHHLFKSFNGALEVQTHMGIFKAPNMTSLQVFPLQGRDLIIVKMPKDFPAFPQKLHFRGPKANERVCMVGSNFQNKSISSTVSETSPTHPIQRSTFWKHWIDTNDGQCGLPIVSTHDGCILGLHSLANNNTSENYFAAFDDEFEGKHLRTSEHMEWVKNWKYNPDKVLWGSLQLKEDKPNGLFKTTKLVSDLHESTSVREQGENTRWMYNALENNIIATNYLQSQLVTRHVVKGECMHFSMFLSQDKEAAQFFKPLMWAYGKSKLNTEAYIKDLMKYSEPIEVGVVDADAFEEAVVRVILYLKMKGFRKCSYITDEDAIFQALNMKAAVGALYGGKKQDYFKNFTQQDKEQILRDSCFRLYKGSLGVWNGSLKAELRCKEKIDANKTRTFTAAPIDTLLAGKVCVDDFNNNFYAKNIECCWTVGMTKFYGGWNKLLTALPNDWLYCDADGSRFDSSLTPYLINAIITIRSAYMEEWDIGEQMLKNLYTEIVYTPISTPDGTIVKKFRGNNSGQPSTVVDNSLMVVLAMHYAFVREGIPYCEIEDICKFFVNGDDLLIGVNPEHEEILDRLGGHFSDLGLNYDFSSRTRDKSELWFMSHRGLKCEGIYIPKLEEERIVSILQWDRATTPENRLEAICAAMIEAWGYPELIHQIRRFYKWLLEQEPFATIASEGNAPYISSLALRRLYLNEHIENDELDAYLKAFAELDDEFECDTFEVHHQAKDEEKIDAGDPAKKKEQIPPPENKAITKGKDKDINAGTSGTMTVPRIKAITTKMRLPKARGSVVLNLDQLLEYRPQQVDLSNTRATQEQFSLWYEYVKNSYDVSDTEMATLMNGLMVWCIENGTSPNINGEWVMMDGETQVTYPLKPVIEGAKPTFRQIMAHFSDVAEAYIELRNTKEAYMPRYGLIRNLRDMSLARYAFDFYEITSRTPNRAREAHIQMKAAALKSAQSRLFGLDGGISTQQENTERHTTEDVNSDMHTLLGVRNM